MVENGYKIVVGGISGLGRPRDSKFVVFKVSYNLLGRHERAFGELDGEVVDSIVWIVTDNRIF